MKTFKHFFLLLVSFAVVITVANAQENIDSLENRLQKTIPDSTRINILLQLSHEYQYVIFPKSKQYAEEALKIAKETGQYKAQVRASQAMGSLYKLAGDYTTSLKFDNQSLQLSLALKDSAAITNVYNFIGDDYFEFGEYDEAYFYFITSYRLAHAVNDSLQMTLALHNVGRVFKELGQYDRALNHFHISREMSTRINYKTGIAYSDDEIGDVLLRRGVYDSAMLILMQSLKETKKLKEYALEPATLTKIATLYLHKGDYKTALAYYDSTYAFHLKTKNRFGIAEVELGRGLVYMKQKNYDEAHKYIGKSANLAQAINARVLEIKCYNQLSYLWELKGDYKKSLGYFKQFKVLEDSLFSQETQEKLLRDQIRFETESKDNQIAVLSEQQAKQKNEIKKQEFVRNILVVVMALSVILLVSVYRSGRRRRQINTLLLHHQKDTEKRSEELERLNQVKDKFFSIISHDLRSPINALAGMLNLMDKGAVSKEDMPKHLKELKGRFNHTRTLLNNLLDWTLLQMDKLNLQPVNIDIQKIVEENIQLLEPIQEKQIKLTNNIPLNAMAFADSNTINLVIRNLMTNAMKFTNDGGEIKIGGEEKVNTWLICVKDNGIGIAPDVLDILFDKTAPYTTRGTANEKGTGLGLILCKEFVEKNGGKIWAESREGIGSTFWFTLPKPSAF